MPKAHIRNGELTIPLSDEIRKKLYVREGEEFQAHPARPAGVTIVRPSRPRFARRASMNCIAIITIKKLPNSYCMEKDGGQMEACRSLTG